MSDKERKKEMEKSTCQKEGNGHGPFVQMYEKSLLRDDLSCFFAVLWQLSFKVSLHAAGIRVQWSILIAKEL